MGTLYVGHLTTHVSFSARLKQLSHNQHLEFKQSAQNHVKNLKKAAKATNYGWDSPLLTFNNLHPPRV